VRKIRTGVFCAFLQNLNFKISIVFAKVLCYNYSAKFRLLKIQRTIQVKNERKDKKGMA
jgi:hypothetical protein